MWALNRDCTLAISIQWALSNPNTIFFIIQIEENWTWRSSFLFCLVCAFLGFKKKNCAFLKTQFFIIYIFFLSFSFFTFFFFPCIYIFALSFWRTCMCLQGIYFWVVLTTMYLLTTIFFTFFWQNLSFFCNLCHFFSFIGIIWCLFCT